MYDQISDVWLFLAAAFFIAGLAVYAFNYRKIPGAGPYALHKAAISSMLLSLVLASSAINLSAKIFWVEFYNISMIIAVVAWLVLTLLLNGYGQYAVPRKMVYPAILPAVTVFLILTNGSHGIYFRKVFLEGGGIKVIEGPFEQFTYGCGYLVLFSTIALFMARAFRIKGVLRTQAVIMAVSTFVTTIGHFMWRFGQPAELSQIMLAGTFIISGFMDVFALFWLRLFDVVTVAQEAVTQTMGDGLFVLDKEGIVIGMNPAARRMLGKSNRQAVGKPAEDLFGSWPADLMAALRGNNGQPLEKWSGQTCYRILCTTLSRSNKKYLGKAIVFQDITAEKRAQEKLLEQENALAVLKERDRLGRELHDGQGQMVSYFQMQLEAASTYISSGKPLKAQPILKDLIERTQGLNADLRESITGLKAPVERNSIFGTLNDYLKWFSQNYGIKTSLNISGDYSALAVSPLALVQLQRIIQEAMANTRKHASAQNLNIAVKAAGDRLELIIEDDGTGFDVEKALKKKGSFGLHIMKERADEIGAEFEIRSGLSSGTIIRIVIPCEKKTDDEKTQFA